MLVLAASASAFSGVARADPPTFATATANCSGSGYITFPAQSTAHPDVLLRYSSVSSQGRTQGTYFAAGDVAWERYGSVEAGTTPQAGFVDCTSGPLTVALADRPTTPATFSGTSSRTGFVNSFLSFRAPGAGQYVLDATVSQGAIKVQGVPGIIQSGGEYSLGSLGAGDQDFWIAPQDGPPAQWTLTARELPVAVNNLSFDEALLVSGGGLPASFSVTGDTTITATVLNSGNQPVRNLGTFPVAQGRSSIPWDGRGTGGAQLPDGRYTLRLVSTDPAGDITSAQTTITLDNTAPSVAMISPSVIKPRQSAAFKIADAESGVASSTVTIDGYKFSYGGPYASLPADNLYVFSVQSGWTLATHRWTITTADRLGNARTVRGTFRASNSNPARPRSCGSFTHDTGGRFPVTYHITVGSSRVSCRTAKSVIRAFWSDHGVIRHGGPSRSTTYWTLKAWTGWRCVSGAGRGSCVIHEGLAGVKGAV